MPSDFYTRPLKSNQWRSPSRERLYTRHGDGNISQEKSNGVITNQKTDGTTTVKYTNHILDVFKPETGDKVRYDHGNGTSTAWSKSMNTVTLKDENNKIVHQEALDSRNK